MVENYSLPSVFAAEAEIREAACKRVLLMTVGLLLALLFAVLILCSLSMQSKGLSLIHAMEQGGNLRLERL